MKPTKVILIFAILFCIAMSAIPMAQALTETQITRDTNNFAPVIFDDTIVYQRAIDDYGNSDIFMYNLVTGVETRISNLPGYESGRQYNPAIYGDKIVWQDARSYNYDIYMYDIVSGTETQITTSTSSQTDPDIYGDTIVWADNSNGNSDIFMYNPARGIVPITDEPHHQSSPAIYGDRIVWVDTRNEGYYDIYMYNIATGVETKVTADPGSQFRPDIYGDIIVWDDYRSGNYDIYMYNLATGVETRITDESAYQLNPVIYGDRIVWEDARNGNYDIYMYDIASDIETQITSTGLQFEPAIYGDKIVYRDNRNVNWDIYMSTLTPPNSAPVVTGITVPSTPFAIGTPLQMSATFTDDAGDTHTVTWDCGDGQSCAGVVDESTGTVTGSHVYTEPGVYTICITVTDQAGAECTQSTTDYVVVYDPSCGFVTGGGWINSPAGAYTADPTLSGKANFGFVSKYVKGANVPTGDTEFQFQVASMNFQSTSYDWLIISGARAQYKGSGTINGAGDYGFILTAIDGQVAGGGGVDKFRIKIWDKTTGAIVYDNQMDIADDGTPTTTLGGGSIVLHK